MVETRGCPCLVAAAPRWSQPWLERLSDCLTQHRRRSAFISCSKSLRPLRAFLPSGFLFCRLISAFQKNPCSSVVKLSFFHSLSSLFSPFPLFAPVHPTIWSNLFAFLCVLLRPKNPCQSVKSASSKLLAGVRMVCGQPSFRLPHSAFRILMIRVPPRLRVFVISHPRPSAFICGQNPASGIRVHPWLRRLSSPASVLCILRSLLFIVWCPSLESVVVLVWLRLRRAGSSVVKMSFRLHRSGSVRPGFILAHHHKPPVLVLEITAQHHHLIVN